MIRPLENDPKRCEIDQPARTLSRPRRPTSATCACTNCWAIEISAQNVSPSQPPTGHTVDGSRSRDRRSAIAGRCGPTDNHWGRRRVYSGYLGRQVGMTPQVTSISSGRRQRRTGRAAPPPAQATRRAAADRTAVCGRQSMAELLLFRQSVVLQWAHRRTWPFRPGHGDRPVAAFAGANDERPERSADSCSTCSNARRRCLRTVRSRVHSAAA